MSKAYTTNHGDVTIDEMANSAIRKCGRGEMQVEEVRSVFRYGEGVVNGVRYRGLFKMDISVQILQKVG